MTDIDLAYREAGSGTALVLLHAFPLSSAMWRDQRAAFADVCRVITPDQRGWGRSPLGVAPAVLDVVADDLAALLDRLSLDRIVLGGLSMGGYVAMAFCRRHPHRVKGLILADTKASADVPAVQENRRRIAAELLTSGNNQILIDEVLPTLLGKTTLTSRHHISERVTALVNDAPIDAAAWAEEAMATRLEAFETLKKIDVPALIVVGNEDRLSTVDDARAMVDTLPQSRLVILPGVGHLSAVEDPAAFNLAVVEFLTELSQN